jgi:hypothetical protein
MKQALNVAHAWDMPDLPQVRHRLRITLAADGSHPCRAGSSASNAERGRCDILSGI